MQPCWNEAKVRAQGTKFKVKSTRWSCTQRGWRQAALLKYVLISFFFRPLLPWCEDKRRIRRDARQKCERRPIASTMAVKCHPSESQTNRPSTPSFFCGRGGKKRPPRGSTHRIPVSPLIFFFSEYMEGKEQSNKG